MRQRHTSAARRLDADGVKSGGDPDILHLARLPKEIGIVGRKAFWPIEERVNSGLGQHRHPVHRRLQDWFKMVEILGQLIELKAFRDAVHAPGFRFRLEGTQHHLACVFLVISAFIRHPQNRQRLQSRDRFGHDVEMFAGLKWYVHAKHLTHLATPHARAIHHMIAGDRAAAAVFGCPVDGGDALSVACNACRLGPLENLRTPLASPLGHGQRDIGGIALSITGQIHATHDIAGVQMRVFPFDLSSVDFFDRNAKRARHCGCAAQFLVPFMRQCDRD